MQPSAKPALLAALVQASNGWVSSSMGCAMPTVWVVWMFVVLFAGCSVSILDDVAGAW